MRSPRGSPRETAGRHSRAESLPAKAVSTPRRSYDHRTRLKASGNDREGRASKTAGVSDLHIISNLFTTKS